VDGGHAAQSGPKVLQRDGCITMAPRSRRANTCYCFFSGIAGVTGCAPPVDFGPGVTPALFSVELLELLAGAVSLFGFVPFVGPLPASLVDVAPFVGPLPASAFGCARAGTEKPKAIIERSKLRPNGDIKTSLEMHLFCQVNSI
jgi:hypothetical protein